MTGAELPRTILFDLYGTLVPGGSRLQRDTLAFQMAEILEVDHVMFADIVRESFDARVRGTMGGLTETISQLAKRAGGSPSTRQITLAADRRLIFAKELLQNRYSESNVMELKAQCHQLGIITDCSSETPMSWSSSWLHDVVDAVAFSCELGIRKPDPAMYLAVTRRLNVAPEGCLFIGDGDSNELDGARALGMSTTMLIDPYLLESDRLGGVSRWSGDTITSITELVTQAIE